LHRRGRGGVHPLLGQSLSASANPRASRGGRGPRRRLSSLEVVDGKLDVSDRARRELGPVAARFGYSRRTSSSRKARVPVSLTAWGGVHFGGRPGGVHQVQRVTAPLRPLPWDPPRPRRIAPVVGAGRLRLARTNETGDEVAFFGSLGTGGGRSSLRFALLSHWILGQGPASPSRGWDRDVCGLERTLPLDRRFHRGETTNGAWSRLSATAGRAARAALRQACATRAFLEGGCSPTAPDSPRPR